MSSLPAWLQTPPPTLGLQLDAHRITAVAVDRMDGAPVLRAVASAALPPGAIVPSLTSHNVLAREAVVGAVRGLVEQIGGRPRLVALAIPDTAAKVSLLPFDQLPSSGRDLDKLVRLQLRKSVPFPVEDAQVTWSHGGAEAGSSLLVVTAMRRDIVQEYEGVCAAAGLHAGTVDLATFSVVNLALLGGPDGAGLPGDTLLVHVTPSYASVALLRDGALIFFRTRNDATEPVEDVVHQTRMFYEDRLNGQGFARVLLVAGPDVPDRDTLTRNLTTLFEAPIAPLTLEGIASFGARVSASAQVVGQVAAPAGIVLRESLT